MPDPRHSKQTVIDGIHTAIAYEYATTAAMLAATGFTPEDVGKLSRHLDDNSVWILVDDSPATWVQVSGGVSASLKAGVIVPGSFSGNPKKATVAFSTPYLSTAYAVTLAPLTNGAHSYSPDVESKTTSGFVVNLNSNNLAGLIEVGWHSATNGS
jgi:hypothetical protein